ncbi:MAG: hypothetical protein KBS70_01020 [Bacteroidales bacterium]|nr:hypothetical protein [Candidatus Colicola equi]
MKKLAIFVEGPTEAEFITRLLRELVVAKKLSITTTKMRGGRDAAHPRIQTIVAKDSLLPTTEYLVNIYISCTDNRVNSDVKDNINNLKVLGFDLVIALKDLRGEDSCGTPRTLADLPNVDMAERYVFSKMPIPVVSVIAVMEIETWFIGETNHYSIISSSLTQPLIQSHAAIIGVDPYVDMLEDIVQPAETLNEIYNLVGLEYTKEAGNRQRTINALDMTNLYVSLPNRIVRLQQLVSTLDNFFV